VLAVADARVVAVVGGHHQHVRGSQAVQDLGQEAVDDLQHASEPPRILGMPSQIGLLHVRDEQARPHAVEESDGRVEHRWRGNDHMADGTITLDHVRGLTEENDLPA
jgi:hypothetical protein